MDDRDELLMTPGPTALPPEVREAMSQPLTNPDVEAEFSEYYRTLLDKLARVYGVDGVTSTDDAGDANGANDADDANDDVLVLAGEGMLGLEASVASLIESGEEVLCLANGIFGEGFADFVGMHGGEPVVHEVPYDAAFDVEDVKSLVEDHDFAAATAVHCETPTGVLNDLEEILAVLQDAGVLTVVDAVSSLGGTEVPVEQIDVCLGASQKCFSSPPGLTTLSVSERAWEKVEASDQDTFYTSLAPWQDIEFADDEPVHLPYTHSVSNLYALEASLERILDEGRERVFERHESVARQCRERGRDLGLEIYPESDDLASPTVTAFRVEGRATEIQRRLEADHDVIVATSLGDLADDVLRVGHMGYNAEPERVEQTMDALEHVLER